MISKVTKVKHLLGETYFKPLVLLEEMWQRFDCKEIEIQDLCQSPVYVKVLPQSQHATSTDCE